MLTHVRGHSYTCGRCGKTLENWNKFWIHQRIHRQKRGRFFCSECGQGFRFAGLYRKHLQEHTEKKPYLCHLCPYTCSCEENLKAHQNEWHGSSKPYTCSICQKGFFHQENLERHLFINHRVQSYHCSFCSLSFFDSSELQLHLKTHANCGGCDASFKTLNLLFRHQLCHSSRSTMTWQSGQIVGQVSNAFHPQKVPQHYRHNTSTGLPFFQPEKRTHHCNLCGKRFKYSSLLQQHQFLHTGQKPFRCPDCGKTFAFAQNMRAHWRQHRKCTHRCLRCSLSFLDLTSLSGVQRINSCPLCPLTFPDVASLKAHMLIHEADEAFGGRGRGTSSNGEDQDTTTFVCPCCHVTLPDQRSLEIHMVSHITPQQATNVLSRVAVNNGMEVLRGNWFHCSFE
uniref:C2H2-type domain-containing protein n=1 Tax=Scleropages formosus TaxID=113540 RepID=A0A8C9TU19_SCLFO